MVDSPLVSLIILNYNGKPVLRACLVSVLKTDYPNYEILVVDNASTDDSINEILDLCQQHKNLRVIKNDKPMFCAGGFNTGIKHAAGQYLVFLNNDTEFDKDWLRELLKTFDSADVAAVQPKILNHCQRNIIDHAGGCLDVFGFGFGRGHGEIDHGQYDVDSEIFYANDIAMAVRKNVLDKIGGFDDKFLFYSEDVDLCWRMRLQGYKAMFCHKAKVYHKSSQTVGKFSPKAELSFHARKNRLRMLMKNFNTLSLLFILPVTCSIYILMCLKEVFADGNLGLANTAIMAFKWNIKNLKDSLKVRREVQDKIRKVSEWGIIRKMYKFPLLIRYGI